MYRTTTIFDVGANVGQSAAVFRAKYPDSYIYCFEPVTNAYRLLKNNLRGDKYVECAQMAFGSSRGTGTMALQHSSDRFYLLNQDEQPPVEHLCTEDVPIDTVDNFCKQEQIEHISLMKIDAEGADLAILEGSSEMLSEQRIDIVQTEAGMNPHNDRHASFEVMKEFLESHRYYLFGIYEQCHEAFAREPHLRRVNPIYISQQTIARNRT